MRQILTTISISMLAGSAALLCRCSLTSLAGGGTEDVNARVVTGRVFNSDSTPATFAQVLLIPADYDPVKDARSAILKDTTDEAGAYRFRVPAAGLYTVQIVEIQARTRAMVAPVEVQGDTTVFPTAGLSKPGAVKVMLPSGANTTNGYMYIPGTTFFGYLQKNTGFVMIDSVPATDMADIAYSTTNTSGFSVLRYGVQVKSSDTTVVWNSGWNYSRKIILNTSPSGADIAGSVMNFPVLIRLSADNFDFTQARTNGEDIRFTKHDNTFLSFEIERWDAIGKRAELWVKVDTVYGNDSAQTLTIYWGNIDAPRQSNSAAVFDTGSGFQGIWHLGETDSIAPDATGNGYDGTGYGTSPIRGVIGNGQHFNGTSSVIRMKGSAQSLLNFPMNSSYTLSAWVYHDTLADSITYLVAGKGEHQYFIKNFDLGLSIGQHARQWEFTEYHDNDWQSATFVPATAKSWVYLVGIRDGSNEYLYVNGILAMNKIFAANQGQPPQDTSDDFAIGGFLRPVTTYNQGYAYFSGAIDEVNVSSRPRSADWVKLSYMNQREKDALVRW